MMILVSQAYVLRRIWEVETSNESRLKRLLKSWTSHSFVRSHFKNFLYERGIIGYTGLRNFQEINREKWLKASDRYNLYPQVWYAITPRKWRFEVSEHWKMNRSRIFDTERDEKIYPRAINPSILIANPSLERTEKRRKLFRNNLLKYSYFGSGEHSTTKKLSKLGYIHNSDNYAGGNNIDCNSETIAYGIRKYSFLRNERSPINRGNSPFTYNLSLWLIPEFMEWGNAHRYDEIVSDLETSIMRNQNHEILRNSEVFRGSGNRSIRQWRWKSNNSEKKFKRLGDMASLMTFMQNQEAMISLSGETREDLELFNLFFRRNTDTNRLTINSENRSPRLLDDRILVYKTVSALSSFRQRLERVLDPESIDECFPTSIEIPRSNEKKEFFILDSFDLENILLPKSRRKFRIMNSLSLGAVRDTKSRTNFSDKIGNENTNTIISNENRIIKRFLWSSYRFEDLACTSRFWLGTTNGSRFSMLRFRTHPPL